MRPVSYQLTDQPGADWKTVQSASAFWAMFQSVQYKAMLSITQKLKHGTTYSGVFTERRSGKNLLVNVKYASSSENCPRTVWNTCPKINHSATQQQQQPQDPAQPSDHSESAPMTACLPAFAQLDIDAPDPTIAKELQPMLSMGCCRFEHSFWQTQGCVNGKEEGICDCLSMFKAHVKILLRRASKEEYNQKRLAFRPSKDGSINTFVKDASMWRKWQVRHFSSAGHAACAARKYLEICSAGRGLSHALMALPISSSASGTYLLGT